MSQKNNIKKLANIYLTFLKLGSVSFGGGYAMLSLMEREIVEDKKWIDKEKIVDVFAVSESLPGAIALNSSAFVGFSIAGIPGAVCALLGNLTPSVIVMTILSAVFLQFSDNAIVNSAFNGIRPVIVGLILYAAYKIGKIAIKDIYSILITCIALLFSLIFHNSVIFVIIGGITLGLVVYYIRMLKGKMTNHKENV